MSDNLRDMPWLAIDPDNYVQGVERTDDPLDQLKAQIRNLHTFAEALGRPHVMRDPLLPLSNVHTSYATEMVLDPRMFHKVNVENEPFRRISWGLGAAYPDYDIAVSQGIYSAGDLIRILKSNLENEMPVDDADLALKKDDDLESEAFEFFSEEGEVKSASSAEVIDAMCEGLDDTNEQFTSLLARLSETQKLAAGARS